MRERERNNNQSTPQKIPSREQRLKIEQEDELQEKIPRKISRYEQVLSGLPVLQIH